MPEVGDRRILPLPEACNDKVGSMRELLSKSDETSCSLALLSMNGKGTTQSKSEVLERLANDFSSMGDISSFCMSSVEPLDILTTKHEDSALLGKADVLSARIGLCRVY